MHFMKPLDGALYGIKIGLGVWLGFVATVQLTGALFMKNSMKLFAINTVYQLVCYVVMGAILAVWRQLSNRTTVAKIPIRSSNGMEVEKSSIYICRAIG